MGKKKSSCFFAESRNHARVHAFSLSFSLAIIQSLAPFMGSSFDQGTTGKRYNVDAVLSQSTLYGIVASTLMEFLNAIRLV